MFSEPRVLKDVFGERQLLLRAACLAYGRLFLCQILHLGSPHAVTFIFCFILVKFGCEVEAVRTQCILDKCFKSHSTQPWLSTDPCISNKRLWEMEGPEKRYSFLNSYFTCKEAKVQRGLKITVIDYIMILIQYPPIHKK